MEEAKRLIFQGVKAVNNVNANMIFFLLRIDHCNAAFSNGFSAADVKYRVIRESDDRHARILSCNFTDLFIDGMKLLSDVENNDGNLEKLQLHERNAMLRLYDFFKNLGERVRLGLSNDNVGLSQPFLGQDNGRFFGWGGGVGY